MGRWRSGAGREGGEEGKGEERQMKKGHRKEIVQLRTDESKE
jgi:hypothetical protein